MHCLPGRATRATSRRTGRAIGSTPTTASPGCRGCGASRPPVPRRSSTGRPSTTPTPSRPRSASATRRRGTAPSPRATSRRASSRRSPTRRSSTPSDCWPPAKGVFVEPASAASVAGLLQCHENGALDPGQLVVCTVTGNGLKDIETALAGITISTTTVPADVAAAAAALGLCHGMQTGHRDVRLRCAHVRVPATSANLGPGFDALGLALAWYDDVSASARGSGLHDRRVAARAPASVPRDESHLVVRAMDATFAELGEDRGGLALRCDNRIPHGRGLGSSAAAIVAGVLLARALVRRRSRPARRPGRARSRRAARGPPRQRRGRTAGRLHASPGRSRRGARAVRLEPAPSLRAVVLLPDVRARHRDGSRAAARRACRTPTRRTRPARSALLVHALTAEPDLLLAATEDRLHQAYREPAMPADARAGRPAPGRRAGGRRLRCRAQRPRARRAGAHRGCGGRRRRADAGRRLDPAGRRPRRGAGAQRHVGW